MSESRDDHADIELQLDRLARLDGDDERLLQLVADLKADVERHVRHEEDEVFVAAEALFDPGEAQDGQAFLQRKKQLASGAISDDGHEQGDDADLSERPVSLQTSAPALDPGLEDRGVGSDGSSAASVEPDPSPPSQSAATDWDESEDSEVIEASEAQRLGGVDSADAPQGDDPVTGGPTPAAVAEQPKMDQGFEDRGIGSPQTTPLATPPKSDKTEGGPPVLPLKPHDPEKQAQKHEKKSHPKAQAQAPDVGSKVRAAGAEGYLVGGTPRGFEGQNSGGRNGQRSQRENHLSRDKSAPRVADGRSKRGPENDR